MASQHEPSKQTGNATTSAPCAACGFDRAGIDPSQPCPECGQTIARANQTLLKRFQRIFLGARILRWMFACFLFGVILKFIGLFFYQHWPANAPVDFDTLIRIIDGVVSVAILLFAIPGVSLITAPPTSESGSAWLAQASRWTLLGGVAVAITARLAEHNTVTLAGLLAALAALLIAAGVVMLHQLGEAFAQSVGQPASRFGGSGFGSLIQLGAIILFGIVAFRLVRVALGQISMPVLDDFFAWTGLIFLLGVNYAALILIRAFKASGIKPPALTPSSAPQPQAE